MLLLRLDVADLAAVRFAVSPLQETVLSNPSGTPRTSRCSAKPPPLLDQLDWPLLQALVGPRKFLPDFLTPQPPVPAPDIDDEFAAPADRLGRTRARILTLPGPRCAARNSAEGLTWRFVRRGVAYADLRRSYR